jgi:hypothetical protein
VSIYVRVKTRFDRRLSEWMMAVITALWGLVLIFPSDTYDTSTVFTFISHVVPEAVFGTFMMFFGVLRLLGLVINGARQDVTPWIRVVSAAVGFMIWGLVVFSFALSGVISTWLATYPIMVIVELANVSRAAHDAGEYRANRST